MIIQKTCCSLLNSFIHNIFFTVFHWVDIKRRQHRHHISWEYETIVHKMLWVSIHNNTHMHTGVTTSCSYQDEALIGNKAAMLFHLKQFYTKKISSQCFVESTLKDDNTNITWVESMRPLPIKCFEYPSTTIPTCVLVWLAAAYIKIKL